MKPSDASRVSVDSCTSDSLDRRQLLESDLVRRNDSNDFSICPRIVEINARLIRREHIGRCEVPCFAVRSERDPCEMKRRIVFRSIEKDGENGKIMSS